MAPVPIAPEVIVIGDGAFHSTELMGYLSDKYPDKGWHCRLRLHSDTYVQLSVRLSNGDWKQLGQLAPEEGGEHRYLDGVYLDGVSLTKDDPYGPVNGPVGHLPCGRRRGSVVYCHVGGEGRLLDASHLQSAHVD